MNTKEYSGLTPQKAYQDPILFTIMALGGHTNRAEIHIALPAHMTFTEADQELLSDGAHKWERVIGYAVGELRKQGLVEPANRNGIHISAKGRAYLDPGP